jgi:hypothetical protein
VIFPKESTIGGVYSSPYYILLNLSIIEHVTLRRDTLMVLVQRVTLIININFLLSL